MTYDPISPISPIGPIRVSPVASIYPTRDLDQRSVEDEDDDENEDDLMGIAAFCHLSFVTCHLSFVFAPPCRLP
jgi:hypothetical protein